MGIWIQPPPQREEPPGWLKALCRIFWFICAPVHWLDERNLDPNRLPVENESDIEIAITNTYYDAAANVVGEEQKRCRGENHCELYLVRFGWGLKPYPEFNGVLVLGVRTKTEIRLFGEFFRQETWETDGFPLP